MSHRAYGGPGNAEVSRTQNLQVLEMLPSTHPPGNASVMRTRNLQFYEMTHSVHPPGDAYLSRTRNLQYFEMKSLLYQFKINITSFAITNQSGYPMTNFLRGDVVQLNLTITNSGGADSLPLADGLLSVMILDPLEIEVHLTYTFIDIEKGQNENFIFGYRIPMSASPGAHTIKVMVFTDWPSQGGLGLAVKESTFTES